jgi:hypothetical protein
MRQCHAAQVRRVAARLLRETWSSRAGTSDSNWPLVYPEMGCDMRQRIPGIGPAASCGCSIRRDKWGQKNSRLADDNVQMYRAYRTEDGRIAAPALIFEANEGAVAITSARACLDAFPSENRTSKLPHLGTASCLISLTVLMPS